MVEDKSGTLEPIVEKITIGKDEIDLSLYYAPGSKDVCKNLQSFSQAAPWTHFFCRASIQAKFDLQRTPWLVWG